MLDAAGDWRLNDTKIVCLVWTRERFMGVGQVLTMPLFFASNAICASVTRTCCRAMKRSPFHGTV